MVFMKKIGTLVGFVFLSFFPHGFAFADFTLTGGANWGKVYIDNQTGAFKGAAGLNALGFALGRYTYDSHMSKAEFSGSSVWANLSGDLSVGVKGPGTFTIENGARVDSWTVDVGRDYTNGYRPGRWRSFLVVSSGSLNTIWGFNISNADVSLEKNSKVVISGDSTIDALGTLSVDDSYLSTRSMLNDGSIVFSSSSSQIFEAPISGVGKLEKKGPGTTALLASSSYTGATSIQEGTLLLGRQDSIGRTSAVAISKNATLDLNGKSQALGESAEIKNAGTILFNGSDEKLSIDSVTLRGNLINSGALLINNCNSCAGQTYIQDGNWIGQKGIVSIGVVLGGDNSLTDKLIVTGVASGTTRVMVVNEGGVGARTLEGIEIITTGLSAPGTFIQGNRIVAGSSDYQLKQGTVSGLNMNNWYLVNNARRPEIGSYASNLQAANTMFNDGMSITSKQLIGGRQNTNLWFLTSGGRSEGQIFDGEMKFSTSRKLFQMGADIFSDSFTGQDVYYLGVMAGRGQQHSKTRNDLSGYSSKGIVSGHILGIYGRWFRDEQEMIGLYAGGSINYGRFSNQVNGEQLPSENYKSKGFNAFLESGYALKVRSRKSTEGIGRDFYITPQVQVWWSGVNADTHVEYNKTKVQGLGSDNLRSRLGIRLSLIDNNRSQQTSVGQIEKFIEVGGIYNKNNYGAKVGSENFYMSGVDRGGELKFGLEGHLNKSLAVSANLTKMLGKNGYRDTRGMLGMEFRF